ncbi:MAG: 2-amino-4-hydroxy-6-hydroxymethyldihydropteridine diphosphokinase [Actinobacteria bacterium]|nr:MAG: 2-amino-4-hydroxy-6-hydroxymethyldihydropteridine diphosphokinase [Actinomycetota bacterium]
MPLLGSIQVASVVYLSLGSNIGERKKSLEEAIKELKTKLGILAISSVYQSKPIGLEDQPDFYNLVIKARTDLNPHQLLDYIQHIEVNLGRKREARWGPRTIDIDILLYNNQVISSDRLVIPHPRMIERLFVLKPLLEVEPELELPDRKEVKNYLEKIKNQKVEKITEIATPRRGSQ